MGISKAAPSEKQHQRLHTVRRWWEQTTEIIFPVTKQTNKEIITSPRGVGPVARIAPVYDQKHPVSNNTYIVSWIYMACELTGKYESYTRKKAGNRNCLWEQANFKFDKKKSLQSSHYKYLQRLKETMIKEVRECVVTMSHQVKNINRQKLQKRTKGMLWSWKVQ